LPPCCSPKTPRPVNIADRYPGSPIYDKPYAVVPGARSAVGATAPQTYENASHNNDLSFIATGDGVVSLYLIAPDFTVMFR
jgi:hypothetical protein